MSQQIGGRFQALTPRQVYAGHSAAQAMQADVRHAGMSTQHGEAVTNALAGAKIAQHTRKYQIAILPYISVGRYRWAPLLDRAQSDGGASCGGRQSLLGFDATLRSFKDHQQIGRFAEGAHAARRGPVGRRGECHHLPSLLSHQIQAFLKGECLMFLFIIADLDDTMLLSVAPTVHGC
jgi:hypothetical protein